MYKKPNHEYKNISKAQAIKRDRLYKRIYSMLAQNNCLFITMTFNNETMKKTTEETRRRYIKRFLNEQASAYILNRDYGTENKREHYHALIVAKYQNMIYLQAYKLGQINILKVNQLKRYRKNNKSLEDIAKDLMIHSIKESTNNNKIIYSRNLRKNIENPYKTQINCLKETLYLKQRTTETS